MKVKLLYFAWMREKTGISEEIIVLPENIQTVSDLIDWQKQRGPKFEDAFDKEESVRVALDQEHTTQDASLVDVLEIAFFPPVTGG